MNQSLTLDRHKPQTKRIVFVDMELSEAKSRIAQHRVHCSAYAEVRCIQCEFRNGTLYLRGQVTSFYLKQLSQEAVRTVEGIEAISNCVDVHYPDR